MLTLDTLAAGSAPLLSVALAEAGEITETVVRLLFALAVILFAAKVVGEATHRLLKLPPVLAEVGVGVLIGPYALGGISFFGFGPLFQIPEINGVQSVIPVNSELWAIAQIGSIVLLFMVGLETNLKQFIRYAGPGTIIASGGVIVPFALGAGATALLGYAGSEGYLSQEALFMGAIMTATSVGITARVLGDLGRLDSPEGITIIAAAVVDDVLGILVLTVVLGLGESGGFSFSHLGLVAVKALGFWLGLTGIGLLVAPYIEKGVARFRSPGAGVALTLALALFAAGMAEVFGLAFIIGAFSMGLALSITDLGHRVEQSLTTVAQIVVPVFFVVMGMLVDVGSMLNAVWFGLLLSGLAILGKLFGCGLPALATGFNLRGSVRVGVGMIPRGEVALIIAGIGLANGVIGPALFGVSIMMTVVTTALSPALLIPLFRRGGSGLRKPETTIQPAPVQAAHD